MVLRAPLLGTGHAASTCLVIASGTCPPPRRINLMILMDSRVTISRLAPAFSRSSFPMILQPGPYAQTVQALKDSADADVFIFNSGINNVSADRLIEQIRSVGTRRPNAILALVTNGGSADAAYRISRCIKRHYTSFTLLVFGVCYSAGTLVAIGANVIVMSEFGQLGPLDVQLADKNEYFGQTPALDVSQALATLSNSAFDFFSSHFLSMGPGRGMNTQTASEIAKTLTLGIIEPIAKQIDPLLLGRVDRSMKIAQAYAERLNPNFKNIKRLVENYPSHEFVIDFEEARSIFESVRVPNQQECAFESLLRDTGNAPNQNPQPLVEHISIEQQPANQPNEPEEPTPQRNGDGTPNGAHADSSSDAQPLPSASEVGSFQSSRRFD